MEYAHPTSSIARATEHDVGAFEYGNTGATPDGGVADGNDGGVVDGDDMAGGGGSGGVADMPGTPTSKHGCSCGGDGGDGAETLLVLALIAAALLVRRRFTL